MDRTAGIQSDVSGDGWRALRPGLTWLGGHLQTRGGAQPTAGPLSGGGRDTSGAGCSDGSPVGTAGGECPAGGPRFDQPVGPNGYAWWYVDALSEDGRHALTVIAFVGSVFSPYYALARRHADADPANHCAVNVVLYGPKAKRWAMTERGARSLSRDATSFAVGPSALHWEQGRLVIRIDEIAVPLPLKLRGKITLTPHAPSEFTLNLDGAARHHWRPIAPSATVELAMEKPALRWRGTGYFDSNWGSEPLEKGFIAWDWSRAHGDGATAILYHGEKRGGGTFGFAIACDAAGRFRHLDAPRRVTLPTTMWRIGRKTRADSPADARLLRTYEDTPFYARSLVETRLFGRRMIAMHESLSLDRFANPLVQLMLPFRMPRRVF